MAYNPQNANGQATMANSQPMVLASDQSSIPVTASAGTNLNTSALALDASLTGGTQRSKITDGTTNAAVKAASTAAAAADTALVVAISPNNYAFGYGISATTVQRVTLAAENTYMAATTAPFAAVAGTLPFFTLYGSASKTIKIRRIMIGSPTLTAVAYLGINLAKYSTAVSAGTATTLVQVPLDASDAAGTATNVSVFTAAPTAGTKIGDLMSFRILGQATTAAAAGIPQTLDIIFGMDDSAKEIVLRGATQGIGLYFSAAPASAVTMSISVEWTEE